MSVNSPNCQSTVHMSNECLYKHGYVYTEGNKHVQWDNSTKRDDENENFYKLKINKIKQWKWKE